MISIESNYVLLAKLKYVLLRDIINLIAMVTRTYFLNLTLSVRVKFSTIINQIKI